LSAYCAISWRPWFCRDFPHFCKTPPWFCRFFTV